MSELHSKHHLQPLARLALILAAALFKQASAQAGAVSCDSRNGAWGTARADEGDPARQYNLAVHRAENRGGCAPYIRAYQFNLPRGTWVVYMTGYVSGKGHCGNWGYSSSYDRAWLNAYEGMCRQGASQITFRKDWQE